MRAVVLLVASFAFALGADYTREKFVLGAANNPNTTLVVSILDNGTTTEITMTGPANYWFGVRFLPTNFGVLSDGTGTSAYFINSTHITAATTPALSSTNTPGPSNTKTVVWSRSSMNADYNFMIPKQCGGGIEVMGLISTNMNPIQGNDPTAVFNMTKTFRFYDPKRMIIDVARTFPSGSFSCLSLAGSDCPYPGITGTTIGNDFFSSIKIDMSHAVGMVTMSYNFSSGALAASDGAMRRFMSTGLSFPYDPLNATRKHDLYTMNQIAVTKGGSGVGMGNIIDGYTADVATCNMTQPPAQCSNEFLKAALQLLDGGTPPCYTKLNPLTASSNLNELLASEQVSTPYTKRSVVSRDALTSDSKQFQFDPHFLTRCPPRPFRVHAYIALVYDPIQQLCWRNNSVNPPLGHWISTHDFILYDTPSPTGTPSLVPTDVPTVIPTDAPSSAPTTAPTPLCPRTSTSSLFIEGSWNPLSLTCGGPLVTAALGRSTGSRYPGDRTDKGRIIFTCGGNPSAADSQQFWQSQGYHFGYNLTMNRTSGMVTINFNGPIRYNNPNDSGHWFALGFPYSRNKQKLPGTSTPINTSIHDAYVIAFTKLDGTRNNDRNATIKTLRMFGTALDAQLVYQDRICQTDGTCSGYTETTSPVTINSIRYLNGNVYVSVSRPMTATMPDDFAFSIDHFEGCGNALWVTYALQPSSFVSMWIVNDTANPQLIGRGPHLWAVDVNIARPTAVPTAIPSMLPTNAPTTPPTITQPALRYAIDWNTASRVHPNRTIDFKYSADVVFTDQTHIGVQGPKNGAKWIVFVRSWTIKASPKSGSVLDSPLTGSASFSVQASSFSMWMYNNITNTLCEVTDASANPLMCSGPPMTGKDVAPVGNQEPRIEFTFTVQTSIVKSNGFTFKPNFMIGNRILICGIDDLVSDFYASVIQPCEDVKDWTTNFEMYTSMVEVAQRNLTTQLFIRRTPPKRPGLPEPPTIRLIMEADQNDYYCVGFFGFQGTFQLGTSGGSGPYFLCKDAVNQVRAGFGASTTPAQAQWWPGELSSCGANTKICVSAVRTTSGSKERWEIDFLFIPDSQDFFPLKTLMDKSRIRFSYIHGKGSYPSPWRTFVQEPRASTLLTGEAFFDLAFVTEAPTFAPTTAPSMNPTSPPTGVPSFSPSTSPTTNPTSIPTTSPTISPTVTSWWEQQVNVTTVHDTGSTITGCLSSAQNHSTAAYLNAVAAVGIDTGGLSAEIVRCFDPASNARRLASVSANAIHAVTYGIRISGKPEWFRWKMLRVINYDLANFAKVLGQQLSAAPLNQKIVSIGPGTADSVFIPAQCRDLPYPRICRFPIRVNVNRTGLIVVGERQFISIAFDQVKDQVAMRWERRGELAWWAYSFTSSNDSSVGKVIVATNHGANMTVYNLNAKSNGLIAGISGSGTALSVTSYAYRGGLEYRINVSAATIGVNTQWKIIPILRFEYGILNTPYSDASSVIGGKGEVVNQLFMSPTLANTQIVPPNYIPSDQPQPPGVCGSNVGGSSGFFGLSLAGAGTQLTFSLKYECALSSVDVLIEGPSNRWWGILFGNTMVNSPAIIYTSGANDGDTLTLHDYYIGATRTLASVQKDPSQDWVILNLTRGNGMVKIGARRPFVTGDALDASFSPRDTNVTFGYAIGATQLQLAKHQFAKIYGTVSFLAPAIATPAPEKKRNAALVAAHGLIGVLGGLVFIPVAIIIMRNRIMIQQTKEDEKFLLLHRIFNGIGALLLLIAVALGFVNVADFGSAHFSQGHHFGGVLIIAIVIFQITWALLRPHYEEGEYKEPLRNAWEWVHFICGYLIVVLVGVQSYFGLVLASLTELTLYLIMLVGVLILSWVIFEIIRRYSYYDYEGVEETEGLVDDDQTGVQMAKTSGASTLNFSGKSQTNITAAATTSPKSESGRDGVAFVE